MARRTSYAWAYELDTWLASAAERDGLRYARRLAEMARTHSQAALAGEDPPFPLTPADIAFEEGVSEASVREKIALARRALHGDLSDSAIYYRKARTKKLAERAPRVCKAPDCEEPLPQRASKRREYHHSRCRRRHYYQLQHPDARPAPHLRGARGDEQPEPRTITRAELERVLEAIARMHRDAEEE